METEVLLTKNVCYASCAPCQVLCRAVESKGVFGAQQVVKNEKAEEVSTCV